jgi:hypothetical protein
MNCKQLIEAIINDPQQQGYDMETDNAAKIIALAYYMGRESATKEISDQYNALIHGQRQRAAESRYHNLANTIIGNRDYIYSGDYAGDMTNMFGADKTSLTVDALQKTGDM